MSGMVRVCVLPSDAREEDYFNIMDCYDCWRCFCCFWCVYHGAEHPVTWNSFTNNMYTTISSIDMDYSTNAWYFMLRRLSRLPSQITYTEWFRHMCTRMYRCHSYRYITSKPWHNWQYLYYVDWHGPNGEIPTYIYTIIYSMTEN